MSSAVWASKKRLYGLPINFITLMITKLFTVKGMTCHACKKLIEMTASDFPEIKKCEVDFTTGKGSMEYDDGFDSGRFKHEVDNLANYTLEFND